MEYLVPTPDLRKGNSRVDPRSMFPIKLLSELASV